MRGIAVRQRRIILLVRPRRLDLRRKALDAVRDLGGAVLLERGRHRELLGRLEKRWLKGTRALALHLEHALARKEGREDGSLGELALGLRAQGGRWNRREGSRRLPRLHGLPWLPCLARIPQGSRRSGRERPLMRLLEWRLRLPRERDACLPRKTAGETPKEVLRRKMPRTAGARGRETPFGQGFRPSGSTLAW